MGNQTKINFFKSIAIKMCLVVLIGVVIAIIANMIVSIPKSTAVAEQAYKDYILSEADSVTIRVDEKLELGYSLDEALAEVIPTVSIDGASSGYAYCVDRDGTMLFHKDETKIGKPVENAVISDLVTQIGQGKKVNDAAVTYDYRGALKFAGYSFTQGGKIVVVTADYDDMMKPIATLKNELIITAICCIFGALIIGFIASKILCKPINQLTEIVRRITNLDLKPSEYDPKLVARGDELGVMSRAMRDMRQAMRDIVTHIEESALAVTTNVKDLQSITDVVNDMCSDNSATTQELAAGMEETSASTISINNNIENMQADAQEIDAMTVEGDKLSEEIMDRATELKNTTVQATNKTIKMYEVVKEKANDAIEGTKSVQRINDLTDTIMSISSQTSLLALNASIEAARAGEAGKGFAVVATEIGNLANQTSAAVSNINGIVGEVNTAVKNISECLTETTQFLEASVLVDYKEFEKVSDQYRVDAESFKKSMQDVRNGVENLNSFISQVVDAVAGIGTTINEAATGVSDIAIKTSDMVNKTSETNGKVDECFKVVKTLDDIVEKFDLGQR